MTNPTDRHIHYIKFMLLCAKEEANIRREQRAKAAPKPADPQHPRIAYERAQRNVVICRTCDEWTPDETRPNGPGVCELIRQDQDDLRHAGKRPGCPGRLTAEVQAGRGECPLAKFSERQTVTV